MSLEFVSRPFWIFIQFLSDHRSFWPRVCLPKVSEDSIKSVRTCDFPNHLKFVRIQYKAFFCSIYIIYYTRLTAGYNDRKSSRDIIHIFLFFWKGLLCGCIFFLEVMCVLFFVKNGFVFVFQHVTEMIDLCVSLYIEVWSFRLVQLIVFFDIFWCICFLCFVYWKTFMYLKF